MRKKDLGWTLVCIALLIMYIRIGYILMQENITSNYWQTAKVVQIAEEAGVRGMDDEWFIDDEEIPGAVAVIEQELMIDWVSIGCLVVVAIGIVISYYDLKKVKEGVSVEKIGKK